MFYFETFTSDYSESCVSVFGREKHPILAFSLNVIVSKWGEKLLVSSVIYLFVQQLSRGEGDPVRSTIENIYSVFMNMQ